MDIRIENLTKTYGDFNAVDHMNLNIRDGELVGLLGPSGCGKSTTLFMLSGLTTPTEGKIYFGDKEVTSIPPEDREIGLVFQNYALYPHMTVEENITFPLINRRVKKAEAKEMALEIAKVVKIDQYMNRKPGELSGGQQQRVAIARALVKKPSVLLLDEPLSNLDAKLRVATREEIRRIQQEVKITTIFVTHDQEEAMSISDRIAVMKDGVLQQYEVPQTMYLNPANTFVANFLGTPEINQLEVDVKDGVIYSGEVVLRRDAKLADGHYKAGIRPESFHVGQGDIKMTVDSIRMTGRDLLIFTQLGNNKVRVLVHSYMQVTDGDTIEASVREGHILVFDSQEKLLGRF